MADNAHNFRASAVDPAVLAAAAADPSNQVGRYVRITPLGSGRLADVWLAYDTNGQREIALKLLSRVDVEDRARILGAAQDATALSHPNVIAVLDSGSAGHVDYIATEYVRGVPLSNTGVSPQEAARLIREAATAVHQAHAQGILHRDIKPGNLLLDDERHIRVSDFGLAPRVAVDGRDVVGTPAYMPPEVARGSIEADERIDVYGLGATLYELATGEPPYRGATDEDVVRKVIAERPPPPRKVENRIPPPLEAIVLKAMAREPAKRYASAGDLAEDLRRFLDGEPVTAKTGGRGILWIATAAAAAVLIGLAAWKFWPVAGSAGPAVTPGPGTVGTKSPLVEAREILAKARAARKDRTSYLDQLKMGIDRLDAAITMHPEDPVALLERARARLERAITRGSYDSGVSDDLDRLLRRDPGHAEAKLLRGFFLWQEYERRQGTGAGIHWAMRHVEQGEQAGYSFIWRKRADLAPMRRAMATVADRIRGDIEQQPGARARALMAFLGGSFSDAAREARKAIDEDPADEALWVLQLMALESSGELEAAAQVAAEGLQRIGRSPTLLAHQAICALALARDGEASKAADDAILLEPSHALALAVRTLIRVRGNSAPAARDDIQKAVTRGGLDIAAIRWARSVVSRISNKYDEAVTDLQWLLQEGSMPLYQFERGGALGRLGRWAEAAKEFEEARRELPTFEVAALERAEALDFSGQSDAALEAYRELAAVAKEPDVKSWAWTGAAYLLWMRGKHDEAYAAFRSAARDAQDARSWARAVQCAQEDEDSKRVLEVTAAWLEAVPTSFDAYVSRAVSHARLKEYAQALAELEKAERAGLQAQQVVPLRSEILEESGDWAAAKTETETAITLVNGNIGLRLRLVRVLLKLKKWDLAEQETRQIQVAESQRDARALLMHFEAQAAAGRGEQEEALARLKKAMDLALLSPELLLTPGPLPELLKDHADFIDLVDQVKRREEDDRKQRATRPFMGISMSPPPQDVRGVLLLGTFPGLAARQAGLRRDDRIVKVGPTVVGSLPDMSAQIGARAIGDRVKLVVDRRWRGRVVTFERDVVLGKRPADR